MKLVEKILKRSNALIQFKQLQMAIEEETRRRKEFYKWVTEEVKAEFINGKVVIHSPVKQRVEQYLLLPKSREYFPAKIHQYGEDIESKVIKGFIINVAAIFDESINLKALQAFMK